MIKKKKTIFHPLLLFYVGTLITGMLMGVLLLTSIGETTTKIILEIGQSFYQTRQQGEWYQLFYMGTIINIFPSIVLFLVEYTHIQQLLSGIILFFKGIFYTFMTSLLLKASSFFYILLTLFPFQLVTCILYLVYCKNRPQKKGKKNKKERFLYFLTHLLAVSLITVGEGLFLLILRGFF